MKNAVQKAIEGGYHSGGFPKWNAKARQLNYRDYEAGGWYSNEILKQSDILLDVYFWQALGKAMGWENNVEIPREERLEYDPSFHLDNFRFMPHLYHWHRFIDHLAGGKDAESFFNELLK